MEPIRSAVDEPRLVVQRFGRTIRIPQLDVSQDVVFVLTYGSSKFDKRGELGARSPGEPVPQGLLGSLGLEVVEHPGQTLLEKIGAIQSFVLPLYLAQLRSLPSGEVPWVFPQGPARGLDELCPFCASEFPHGRAAHFVDRRVGKFLNMEAVEDDLGIGGLLPHGLDERLGHVHGDDLDLIALFRTQLLEEGIEAVCALALVGPDDMALDVVHDQGDVLVVLPVGDLVDPDHVEGLESPLVLKQRHDPADDLADCPPVDAHQLADGGLVRPLSQPGHHFFEVLGEATGVQWPRDGLDMNPTVWAVDATRDIPKPDHATAKPQVAPKPWLLGVVARTFLPADSTPWLSPARLDVDDEPGLFERERNRHQALDTEELLEYCCEAHGVLPVESQSSNSDNTAGFPCASSSFSEPPSPWREGPAFPHVSNQAEAESQSPAGPERSGGGAKRLDWLWSGGYRHFKPQTYPQKLQECPKLAVERNPTCALLGKTLA